MRHSICVLALAIGVTLFVPRQAAAETITYNVWGSIYDVVNDPANELKARGLYWRSSQVKGTLVLDADPLASIPATLTLLLGDIRFVSESASTIVETFTDHIAIDFGDVSATLGDVVAFTMTLTAVKPIVSIADLDKDTIWYGSGHTELTLSNGQTATIESKLRFDQVPEPTSLALVGLGTLVAAWRGRRRAARSAR